MRLFLLTVLIIGSSPLKADTRQLIFQQDQPITYSISELAERLPIEELEVFDIQYGERRSYRGFDIRKVLELSQMQGYSTLMLVSSDGYNIPFDTSQLDNPEVLGLIAIEDTQADEGVNWKLFQHGNHVVNFDPFYLVWAKAGESHSPSEETLALLSKLPWPYQFQEIRTLQETDFAAARPAMDAPEKVQLGFDHYMDHCYKCHQVSGVGGNLSAALDRPSGSASILPETLLSDMIWQIKDFIPLTKMPDYSSTFSSEEADQIAAYLKYKVAE